MKRTILFLTVLVLYSQAAFAYNFSAVAPSGQTLYYSLGLNGTVTVTCPSNNSWGSYSKPIGDLIIPDTVTYSGTTRTVTSIGSYAFYQCSGLTSVTIPNSVTYIGEKAFYGCTGLTSETIPNAVTRIDELAFSNCTGLTSVVFNADSCTYAGRGGRYSYGSDGNYRAFKNCTNITSFTFGNNVKIIPDYLCYFLTGLTSVTIPASVTSIGRSAFSNCTGLTSVAFNSDRCTYAGFWDWYSSDDGITYYNWAFKGCTNITSFVFGDNVKSIPYCLCRELTGLTSVIIPDSVTNMDDGAFMNCTGLTSVTIGNSVTSIGNSVFYHCTNLTSVTIPNSITNIDNYAFYQCYNLASVTIGDSVNSIGTLTFPNSVTTIGNRAFYNCLGFTSVTIGESVTSIGIEAFKNCGNMRSVIFPISLTSIGYHAFNNCALRSITFLSPTPPSIYNGFHDAIAVGNPVDPDVYIPCGSRSQYSSIGIPLLSLHEMYYELSAVSADDSTGRVSIRTEPTCANHNAVVFAVPTNGYRFDHWSTGSTDNPYTLTVTRDTTIIAFFEEANIVTVLVDNPATGSVTGGGTYEDGSSVTITAYPADGYLFDHWSTGSTDNPYTLTVTSDTTITAFFVKAYTVTVLVNPAMGSATGGGVYGEGSSVTITAYPADNYLFDHWNTGSTDNPYTLTVTTDTIVIGYFVSNGGTEGIGEIGEDNIRISILDGCIFVEGIPNEEVRVYDITGRMVQNRSLPSGVYIVKIGTLPAQKVVVMR